MLRAQGLFWDFGFRVQGLGFRVEGLGLGFRVASNPKPKALNPQALKMNPKSHGPRHESLFPEAPPQFYQPQNLRLLDSSHKKPIRV